MNKIKTYISKEAEFLGFGPKRKLINLGIHKVVNDFVYEYSKQGKLEDKT